MMKKFSKEHKAKIADAERKFYSTEEGKTVIVTRNKLQSRTKRNFTKPATAKKELGNIVKLSKLTIIHRKVKHLKKN